MSKDNVRLAAAQRPVKSAFPEFENHRAPVCCLGNRPFLLPTAFRQVPSDVKSVKLTGWLTNGPLGWVSKAHATVCLKTGRGFFHGIRSFGVNEMERNRLFERYREFQSYVGWIEADCERLVTAAPLIEPHLVALVDDFYAEIDRHDDAQGHYWWPGAGRTAQGHARAMAPRALLGDVRRRLCRPPLAGRLAACRDRAGAGLHQCRAVATPDGAGPQPPGVTGKAKPRP